MVVYRDYILSDAWKKRTANIKRTCCVCGSKENIEIHHKSYKRLGNETDNDLAALCRKCHQDTHNLIAVEFPPHLRANSFWNAVEMLKKKISRLAGRYPEPALDAPSAPLYVLRKGF